MKSWLIRTICLTSIIWLGSIYHQATLESINHPYTTDFFKFYLTGIRINHGQPAYWDVPPKMHTDDPCHPKNAKGAHQETPKSPKPNQDSLKTGCLNPNLNPPLWGGLFALLANAPFAWALTIWQATSIACLLISILMISRSHKSERTNPHLTDHFLVLCTVSLAYFPVYVSHLGGQVTLLLTPLVVGSWLALRQGHATLAGIILGCLAVLKPFFGIFFVTLLMGRRIKSATSMAISAAVVSSISVMWWGIDTHLRYMHALRDVTWTAANWNGSLIGFFARIFGGAEGFSFYFQPDLSKILSTACSGTLIWWVGAKIRNDKRSVTTSSDHLFGVTLIIMLLVSPLGWIYYFPWLLIVIQVLWNSKNQVKEKQMQQMLASVFLAITCTPRDLVNAFSMTTAADFVWHGALYSYALIALAGAMHISYENGNHK